MNPSDEESDTPQARIAAGVDSRSLATAWAQAVLRADTTCKDQDRPYMLAVLVEAAMMELPVKTMSVAINEHPNEYAITIKGYKQLQDIDIWYDTFRGPHRNHMLDNVSKVFHQQTDESGNVYVIRLKKVKFQSTASASSLRRAAAGGGGSHVSAAVPSYDSSTTPSGGRRSRK